MKTKRLAKDEGDFNSEWADVMKNILTMDKPKSKNSMILSRVEKLDVKLEKDSENDSGGNKLLPHEIAIRASYKKEWIARGRCKPNSLSESERERKLRRIAVAGVVQLFNAVGKQQLIGNTNGCNNLLTKPKSAASQFKSLDKKSFFNILLGKNEVKIEDDKQRNTEVPGEGLKKDEAMNVNNQDKQWDIFRNDFMMSSKLKDWDTHIDS